MSPPRTNHWRCSWCDKEEECEELTPDDLVTLPDGWWWQDYVSLWTNVKGVRSALGCLKTHATAAAKRFASKLVGEPHRGVSKNPTINVGELAKVLAKEET